MRANFAITPFRIVLLFIVATVCGVLTLPRLSIDWIPINKKNQLTVSFYQPGISPDVIEQQVTSILEGALCQLSSLKKISSSSYYNSGYISLVFEKGINIQVKQLEAAAIIRRVYPQLPPATSYPLISTSDNGQSNNSPFLIYTVHAPQQPFEVKKETEAVFMKSISNVPGISRVMVSGAEMLQLVIEYDMKKCQLWHVEPGVIANALQTYANGFYPGSFTTGNGARYFLKIAPAIANVSDIENTLLMNSAGGPLRLRDVAKVFMEEQEAQGYFRVNGSNSVRLSITAREGENKLVLAKKVKQIVQQQRSHLSAGYHIYLEHDDTEFLQKELNKNYRRTVLSLVILIVFILIAYRSWRYLLVLFSGLVVNLALTAMLAYIFHINIHLYTIAGLAISFGIMIDNAIVMIDYYHRYKNRSYFKALLGASLTTIAALCLVFLLPEEDRRNLDDFAGMIVLALIASMLVALWFTPGLYELVFNHKRNVSGAGTYKRAKTKRQYILAYYHLVRFVATYRKTFIIVLMLVFGLPVFMLPEKWDGNNWYHRWYNNTIGSSVYQQDIRSYSDRWLGGMLWVFTNNLSERIGYRDPERTKLTIQAETPYGTTAGQLSAILSGVEKHLSNIRGIDKYVTNIYSGQSGNIVISFKQGYEQTQLPYQLKVNLIARSLEWGGVKWNIQGAGQGFSNAGTEEIPGYRVTMRGYNYDELEKQAEILGTKLRRHKRVQNVNTNDRLEYGDEQSKEYVLQVDDNRMAYSGTDKPALFQQIRWSARLPETQQYINLDQHLYSVSFREKQTSQYSRYNLLYDAVSLDSGKQARVKDFGEMVLQSTASSIHKEARQYLRAVSFEYMGAARFGDEYMERILNEMKQQMPVGYTAEKDVWTWGWEKSKQRYVLVAILILSVFFICSILFENLRQPIYIISMIPISFIGLFMVFAWSNFYFDQGGYAAFVMLGGLAANAAIFIVNDFNKLKNSKNIRSYNMGVIKAASGRGRTILLTLCSTCCGLVPFLLEGPQEVFWFALAAGTIGGLLFSEIALFLVLPVLLWKKAGA